MIEWNIQINYQKKKKGNIQIFWVRIIDRTHPSRGGWIRTHPHAIKTQLSAPLWLGIKLRQYFFFFFQFDSKSYRIQLFFFLINFWDWNQYLYIFFGKFDFQSDCIFEKHSEYSENFQFSNMTNGLSLNSSYKCCI